MQFQDIPVRLKISFLNLWYLCLFLDFLVLNQRHLVSIAGDIFVILVFFTSISSSFSPITEFSKIFLGIGGLLLCVNFTRYLEVISAFSLFCSAHVEYNLAFYTLVMTLRHAVSKCIRFTVGIMPIFIGYGLCGVALFSPYSHNVCHLYFPIC